MKYYILFGPPGAGKGTHAGVLAEKYNLKHLSTGELLRNEMAAGTELGKRAKAIIEAGSLVPDEVVEGIIERAFDTITDVDGFLLDGFPRTMAQGEALEKILAKRGAEVEAVLAMMIPDEIVKERIARRAKVEGRADDASEEVINNRIRTYHERTEPLIAFYKKAGKYYEFSAHPGTIEENRDRALALMAQIQKKQS